MPVDRTASVGTRRRVPWLRLLLVLGDAAMFNATLLAALWLRFDHGVPAEYWVIYWQYAPWMTAVLIGMGIALGLYNRIWEYASLDAALTVIVTVAAATAVGVGLPFLLHGPSFPRSVIAELWAFGTLAIGGSRFAWRVVRVRWVEAAGARAGTTKALVYGAGHAGVMLARQIKHDPDSSYQVVGFIDEDLAMRGMVAGGFRVLGSSADLEQIVGRHAVTEIIVAAACVEGEQLYDIYQRGQALGVRVRTLPRLLELVNGKAALPQVRDIDVSDVIGRSPVCVSLDLPEDYIVGQTVLVTGAGGSIGSEICRQICRYRPERIVLLGRGENRIHAIYYELREQFPEILFEPVICSITSRAAVDDVLRQHSPSVIFHAAAHKHVFLMECNPVEAVRNNVQGTALLTELADAHGVERFVMISTDKATEPTSVMGATKAFCERVVTHRQQTAMTTRFVAVRFGNVLGSAGSVVPIFQAQARAGRPVTVTDPEADRYFMTIAEAAFLVLQAGAIGEGGEVFVLDMGTPVKIADIARRVLQMSGIPSDTPNAIQYIGLRAGEKLHETLTNSYERLVQTSCPQVRRATLITDAPPLMAVEDALRRFAGAVAGCNEGETLSVLEQATAARFDVQKPCGTRPTPSAAELTAPSQDPQMEPA